jgi:hypothetical protein
MPRTTRSRSLCSSININNLLLLFSSLREVGAILGNHNSTRLKSDLVRNIIMGIVEVEVITTTAMGVIIIVIGTRNVEQVALKEITSTLLKPCLQETRCNQWSNLRKDRKHRHITIPTTINTAACLDKVQELHLTTNKTTIKCLSTVVEEGTTQEVVVSLHHRHHRKIHEPVVNTTIQQ